MKLPRIGSPAYHVMLAVTAIGVLGPLAGVSASFMNFSIGFFVSGQVLAGILGSVVTFPYGPEGRHGGNYIQTMAASVGGMCAMVTLVQAELWLGMAPPPAWQLALYFMCVGMFGVGLGMLYTPILIDRMQLAFPSGFAVANILRALTDPLLLRRSVARLGGGMVTGYVVGLASLESDALQAWGVSASTFGAGHIVGLRLALPALVLALIGVWQTPHLVAIGWLAPGAPFRKIGFIIALGGIVGAACVDMTLILTSAARTLTAGRNAAPAATADGKLGGGKLALWIAAWGAGVVWVGSHFMGQPAGYLIIALGLSVGFVLINGIALGISDFNPISSAFVITVFILSALGLRNPGVALVAAGVVMIACAEGGDMQQDRSTGWRLGSSRVVQFRYQVIGIAFGSVLAVALGQLFLKAFPILRLDQFAHPHLRGAEHWQSAMTYKLVGAVRSITERQPQMLRALALGTVIGLAVEVVRKVRGRSRWWKGFAVSGRLGRTADFLFDALVFPSPYASAYGGFLDLATVLWWTGGGAANALVRRGARDRSDLPSDMDTCSLFGGGLIAGDALSALTVGLVGLFKTVL